jgi:threonine dehydrogenase-like Zn-dependent dehydrogenase
MKPLHFTRHALSQMAARGIPRAAAEAAVRECVARPAAERALAYQVGHEECGRVDALGDWLGLRVVVAPGGWVLTACRRRVGEWRPGHRREAS